MLPLLARPLALQVSIAGNVVPLAPGTLQITESLDNLCRVATFDLAGQPAVKPADGDECQIEWQDGALSLRYELFGGTIIPTEIESQPWAYSVTATDQLAKLRDVRKDTDLSLTGLTEGAAWKAIADFCGVAYDDADIADSGYVLGAGAALSWQVDIAGSQILQELDTVFGMATQTIGDNRVIRFPVDFTPTAESTIARSFTRGEAFDVAAHHRSRGTVDDIQNIWIVRGATIQVSAACTAQTWAKAISGNAQLGRRVRVQTQEYSSDLIQDESLAEAIVRRNMDRTNRVPDVGTAELLGDPNIHPGSVLAITDPTYGIDAAPRYYLVRGVDRADYGMSLTLDAGPAGDEGTVTTGTDKICNSTHTPISTPGSFTPPAFGYPPFDLGAPLDFSFPDFSFSAPAIGSPGGGYDFAGDEPAPADTCATVSYADGIAIDGSENWEINGSVLLVDSGSALSIGVHATEGDYLLAIAGSATYTALGQAPLVWQIVSPDGERHQIGAAPIFGPVFFRFGWLVGAAILYVWVIADGIPFYAEIDHAAAFASAHTTHTLTGAAEPANLQVAHDCGGGGGGVSGSWVEDSGSVSSGDGFVHLVDVDSTAHMAGGGLPLDGSQRFQFAGSVGFPGSSGAESDVIFSIGLIAIDLDGATFLGFQGEWAGLGFSHEGFDSYFSAQTVDDFATDCCPGGNPQPGFTFALDYDPTGAGTMTLTLDGVLKYTLTLSTWPADLYPYAETGLNGATIEMDIDSIVMTLG